MDEKEPETKRASMSTDIIKRTAYGVATRGVGAAPRILAEQAYKNTISLAAQRAANRFGANRPTNSETETKPQKKLVGMVFWLMLALTISKDILDIVGDLTLIFSIASIITGPIVTFCVLFYLHLNKVSLDSRKMITLIITTIIGLIPFLNILPETTLNLILIRIFENSALAKKGLTKAISKYV